MRWNIDNIAFLHQPEFFLGKFDNPKMQARHEKVLEESLRQLKAAVMAENDPLKAMHLLNAKDHIQFLVDNLEGFRCHDRLEQAVIDLYGRGNAPFSSSGEARQWAELFDLCDRERLRRCGLPLPRGKSTVFRGSVSGVSRHLSWTPDRVRAMALAERWRDPRLGGGQVYQVEVESADILVRLPGKSEEIFILSPAFVQTAEITPFNPH